MKIEHIAIWTPDLERLRQFYTRYFGAEHNEKYVNEKNQFESYFLSFTEGARLEIMQTPEIVKRNEVHGKNHVGYAHFAISVGSKEQVDQITSRLAEHGYTVVSNPRYTGDGYYESVILDPDNNQIEITI